MIHLEKPHKYQISGLIIASDHEISVLAADRFDEDRLPHVTIQTRALAEFPDLKQSVSADRLVFQPKPGLFLQIEQGERITVYRDDRITDQDITLFLLGSAWGVLCHQRGLFPLHCSAASAGRDAFAFVAESGGGKSTLAASLSDQGFRHVCDDVALAEADIDASVVLQGMPKGLKLWRASADALGLEPRALVTGDTRIEKYYVDPPQGPTDRVLNLKAIYELEFSDDETGPDITRLSGASALKTVYRNVYRVEWLGELGGADRVLSQARIIAERVPVFRFSRPRILPDLQKSSAILAEHMTALSHTDRKGA